MANLYVANVPDELYKALRERARGACRSIAAEVLCLLRENVPTEKELESRRAFVSKLERQRSRNGSNRRFPSTKRCSVRTAPDSCLVLSSGPRLDRMMVCMTAWNDSRRPQTMTSPATTLQRGEFQNEPFIDFSKPENRKAMEDALAQVKGRCWAANTARDRRGKSHYHGKDEIDQSVAARSGDRNFSESYRRDGESGRGSGEPPSTTMEARAGGESASGYLSGGGILRKRNSNWKRGSVFEIGKTWPEADADIAELIDFLRILRARGVASGRAAEAPTRCAAKKII